MVDLSKKNKTKRKEKNESIQAPITFSMILLYKDTKYLSTGLRNKVIHRYVGNYTTINN